MGESPQPESNSAGEMPEQIAGDLRTMLHDLSNALEIIVQTSYLLGLAEMKEPAAEWLKMLEGGVAKALDINGNLRTYVRRHSPK